MKASSDQPTRRGFLKDAALGAAALGLVSSGYVRSSLAAEAGRRRSVMGLTCEPLSKVRIALIGVGSRGSGALQRLRQIEGVEITALCDLEATRLKRANAALQTAGKPAAAEYTGAEDWKKVCERDNVDLVYSCTPWALHAPVSVYAMKQGKHAAIEVPAATSLEECWQLVDTAEETRRHCMMLENCCYDFFELTVLNMARQGILGDVHYAECAYNHDLRSLKFEGYGPPPRWRLQYSKSHAGNPYPTHGLGPVAQLMNINRGDRFEHVTSMSTNPFGIALYARKKYGENSPEARDSYRQGDMNVSLLRTVSGNVVQVQHDTTSPRPYSRIHLISGTRGFAVKYPEPRLALEPNAHEFLSAAKQAEVMKQYEHPLIAQIGERARQVGGHGGMDFIMDYRLIHCLRNGLPLDQDVYDAATWSCLFELGEQSIKKRSAAVEFPDFTRGEWKTAKPWPIVTMA